MKKVMFLAVLFVSCLSITTYAIEAEKEDSPQTILANIIEKKAEEIIIQQEIARKANNKASAQRAKIQYIVTNISRYTDKNGTYIKIFPSDLQELLDSEKSSQEEMIKSHNLVKEYIDLYQSYIQVVLNNLRK